MTDPLTPQAIVGIVARAFAVKARDITDPEACRSLGVDKPWPDARIARAAAIELIELHTMAKPPIIAALLGVATSHWHVSTLMLDPGKARTLLRGEPRVLAMWTAANDEIKRRWARTAGSRRVSVPGSGRAKAHDRTGPRTETGTGGGA